MNESMNESKISLFPGMIKNIPEAQMIYLTLGTLHSFGSELGGVGITGGRALSHPFPHLGLLSDLQSFSADILLSYYIALVS